jgi:TolB protein
VIGGGGVPAKQRIEMRSACLACVVLAFVLLAALAFAQSPDGPFVRLTTDGLLKQRPAWSPDGKWLSFTRHEGATIFVFVRAADGSSERRLTKRSDPEFDAVWSPDGARLALAIDKASPNQGDIDVHTVAAHGDDLKPVATTDKKLSHEEWPAWSPDGQRLVFTSTADDNQDLYVALANGSERKRLTSDPALDAHPAWSPDGKQIVFATNRWGDLELARVEIDGSGLVRLTESPRLDDYPVWSPDGKQIALTSNRDGNFEIYTIDVDGINPRNCTKCPAHDNFPAWTPDGRLTFVSNRDGGFDIYVVAGEQE